MPEKKQKPKPRRKPDDLRKKYPVDKILSQAETLTFAELEKKHKLGKRILHTIIKRYGSEELKKIVSERSTKKRKVIAEGEKQKESLSQIQQYMDNLEQYYTALQTPTLKLANIDDLLSRVAHRLEYRQTSGNEIIRLITQELTEKEYDLEKVESMEYTLKKYFSYSLQTDRVLILTYRTQAEIQEKYVKLESVSRELQDVKTLIKYIFESYNLLDAKSYRKIKEYLTTLAPAIETFFTQYEQSYDQYRAKLFEEAGIGGNTAGEAGTEEAGKPTTASTSNNKE